MAIRDIDRVKCNDCGRCYLICPMDVFGKVGRRVYLSNPEDCMPCYLCEIDCPVDAITIDAERGRPIPLPY
ncbi:MAG: ferredoxin family protein [Chloroflexi bacterium]|nr:ferredoxin family protein [Chloroflexota bacterium]